jgi:hypothetical protein
MSLAALRLPENEPQGCAKPTCRAGWNPGTIYQSAVLIQKSRVASLTERLDWQPCVADMVVTMIFLWVVENQAVIKVTLPPFSCKVR